MAIARGDDAAMHPDASDSAAEIWPAAFSPLLHLYTMLFLARLVSHIVLLVVLPP